MIPVRIFVAAIAFLAILEPRAAEKVFRAGAAIVDISPTNYPVLVNAMFTERTATETVDRLEARALVLDDSSTRIAMVVIDSCMVPRVLIDRAKTAASERTGISIERMLVSSTHTHSAPSAMGCLGSRVDTNYAAFLPSRITEAIVQANSKLVPARIGWAVVDDWEHTFNRRWIRRPDRMLNDPFGERNVRAHMHPGHESPDAIGPSGPVDPALSVAAVQTGEGRPLALLANYSQHYYGSPLLSSDYYGRFRTEMARLLGATNASDAFVAIMSQGTSGDQMWMDYGAPRKEIGYDAYAREVAVRAQEAYSRIQFADWAPLRMAERKITLAYRVPNTERLQWARKVAGELGGRLPQQMDEIYALESIYLNDLQLTQLVLQALRIGDLGITAIPNEVYALTGLKLKAQSPLQPTINVELANGAEGYIPPPEQHKLGGYTTWPARTAGLEVTAEPKIVETLLSLLEEVSGKPRRALDAPRGPYAQTMLDAKPRAYWRFEEMNVSGARDSSGNDADGVFEDGVALYLPGPGSGEGVSPKAALTPSEFSGPKGINRAAHFAGGRMLARVPLGSSYTVEMWFWNGLDPSARPVTGYMFSRGPLGDGMANGDHLGIGGTHSPEQTGKLLFFNGDRLNQTLVGRTALSRRTWHHVAFVREGKKVTVFLNGQLEISGEGEVTDPSAELFIGGRNDGFANFEGKLDEVAIFDRALSSAEITAHFKSAKLNSTEQANVQPESAPLSPEESLKKIHVGPGYEVELVAAEPLVLDPVAIDWDAQGRLWVVEMADYPLGMDGRGKPGGRVRVLEDTNRDGQYDKSVLFAEDLRFPTGLLTWRDGVIVTAAPEILFLKDTDGDGRADVRQVLFSGFLEGNQQLRINGLRWGLDGWVYCAAGGHYRGYAAATRIKSHVSGEEIALGSRDFRFRPDTGEFDPLSGPSQFGRNRDDWGRWFGTQNSHPLWQYVLEDRYLRRNPHVPAPDPTQQVMVPANPKVYPASPQEKRFHSFEQAGHFTSACSGMIYTDDLLFPREETHAFACEPFHNLVHHETLSDDGVSFSARRVEGEETSEFFSSEDRWCRPVMTRTGPDGALWVVDMYRYMIEHPDWLPENGKAELLANYRSGDDKGRIYRVKKKGTPLRTWPNFDSANKSEVSALESPNGWVRDKAQQILLWRGVKLPELERLAFNAPARTQVQALWLLKEQGTLTPDQVERALGAPDARVRENALRLAESFTNANVIRAAVKLIQDPDAKVRLQLACTLGEWRLPAAAAALTGLAREGYKEPFLRAAVMSSAVAHAEALSKGLLQAGGEPLREFMEPLRMLALGLKDRNLLASLLQPALQPSASDYSMAQMDDYGAFVQLLRRQNSSVNALVASDPDDLLSRTLHQPEKLFAAAQRVVQDFARTSYERFAAARLLSRSAQHSVEGLAVLAEFIAPKIDLETQNEAILALGESGKTEVPKLLLESWAVQAPRVRNSVVEQIFRREPWVFDLLQRVQKGEISAGDLDVARRSRLMRHESPRVRELAAAVLKDQGHTSRGSVVAEYSPALRLKGDSVRGAQVFARVCGICHKNGSQGNEIGPDLRSVAEHPPEKLLANILDPSADVQPGYHAYSAALQNGEEIYGVIAAETGNSLVMKLADGSSKTILRKEIAALRSSNVSLMPDGLETAINLQEMADLITFLKGGLAR